MELQTELHTVKAKIERLTGRTDYTDLVAKSFHLGRVGGSGRNIHSLNRKRENSLNKTIDNAIILTALYKRESELERQIKDIDNNGPQKRAEAKAAKNILLAEYWKGLKAGDILEVGNPNGNPKIEKKSAKSCLTIGGCKWTAAEIIGKEAAKLL